MVLVCYQDAVKDTIRRNICDQSVNNITWFLNHVKLNIINNISTTQQTEGQ